MITKPRSLTRQITQRVLLLSLIGMVGISSAIALTLRSTLQQVQKRLNEAAVEATVTFDLFFLELKSDLLATSTTLSTTDNPDQILRQILTRNLSLVDIWLIDKNGQVLAQQRRLSSEKLQNYPLPAWLESPPKPKEVVFSPVQFEEQSPYLEMVVNVTDDIGLSTGILLAKVDLTELWDTAIKIQVGETGYIYLTGEQGQLVASRDRNLLNTKPKLLENQAPEQLIEQNLQLRRGLNDQWVFVLGRSLKVVPWYAFVEQPATEAIAPFILPSLVSSAILLTVLYLIYTSIQFNRRRIISPLLQLRNAVGKISAGELQQTVKITTNDEFGDLANSFNRMTQQLNDSFAKLAKQNEELQQLDHLKDQFLANTSHELRTPLNGMIGIAESMLEGVTGELDPEQQENLTLIAQSGHRLANLVNDILDFSKLRQYDIDLNIKPIKLSAISHLVLTLSQPLVQNKPIELINKIDHQFPWVAADENRLQQILYNLVGNAIKFTEAGNVTISAEIDPDNSDYILITVADTGIGIPEDKLDRIFKSFEQGEGSTAREYGGTGLGLAVTKQLVELHQGKITVRSQLGQGSQFTFSLPLADDTLSDFPVTVLQDRQPTPKALSFPKVSMSPETHKNNTNGHNKIKVLIVDDEPVNLRVLLNNLSLEDYQVIQATNGKEVLELLENNDLPDIILLDVMMPKITGYEVTSIIRETYSPTELPILLLTAKTQVQDIVAGFNVGANDYLTKPIAKDELLARLKTHVNLRKLYRENIRLNAELEITRKLQEMILPSPEELAEISELEIAGFMQPAEEVGGDFYDVFKYKNNIKVSIGDVTGHGLESGLLMIMTQMALRTLQEGDVHDPVEFLDILNRAVYANIQRLNSYKSLTLALLNYNGGILSLSGQHEEMIIVRNNGEVERIDTIDLGFPIGLDEDIKDYISQVNVKLEVGDVVVLYTDGITEAENPENVQYGLERLCQFIQNNHKKSAQKICSGIIEDVKQHISTQKVFDDITLVVLKR